MDAKQPVKVVGGKPLTHVMDGEPIEVAKGAEKIALALSSKVPTLNGIRVDMSRPTLEAMLWTAYVQGRADEAATRGDSK